MLDVGWLVFLGLIAGGSLAVSMIISNRYEAVVFAITAGFFFTILSLTVLAGEDWGVKQEIEHEYFYTPGLITPAKENLNFGTPKIAEGWELVICDSDDTGGQTMVLVYNERFGKLVFKQPEVSGKQGECAAKVFSAEGDITEIEIMMRAWSLGNNPSLFISAQDANGGFSYAVKPGPRYFDESVRVFTIPIPEARPTKDVEVQFKYLYEPSRGSTISAATLFEITGIAITSYPAPTAKIESITETHGTVWLSQWPQMQMAISTFLGLIGLWAFFYAICVAFQFGPGRTKQ